MQQQNENTIYPTLEYFYRVTEYSSVAGATDYTIDFKGLDLLKCKRESEEFYWKKVHAQKPGDLINLSFVQLFSEGTLIENILYGEDQQLMHYEIGADGKKIFDARVIESLAFEGLGYTIT